MPAAVCDRTVTKHRVSDVGVMNVCTRRCFSIAASCVWAETAVQSVFFAAQLVYSSSTPKHEIHTQMKRREPSESVSFRSPAPLAKLAARGRHREHRVNHQIA